MEDNDKFTEINENQFAVGEDQEADNLEQQMRESYDSNPNSKVAETQAKPEGEVEQPKPPQVSTGEIPAEDKEEAEAQTQVEAEAAPAEAETKPKVRPWSELRKTRKENKELSAELEAERRSRRALEDRFKVIEAKLAPAQPESKPNAIPDFNQDPLENLRSTQQLTQQQIAQIAQQQQIVQLQASINADEANFSQTNPDYVQARDWLIEQELSDARTVFAALPEEQRDHFAANLVNQRRAILIATARDTNQSVANLAYNLAKSRGYKAVEPSKPAAPTKPAPEVSREKVLAAKERESVAGASIGNVGASPNLDKKLSRDDIMSLSEKEMDALAAKYGDDWADTQVS